MMIKNIQGIVEIDNIDFEIMDEIDMLKKCIEKEKISSDKSKSWLF